MLFFIQLTPKKKKKIRELEGKNNNNSIGTYVEGNTNSSGVIGWQLNVGAKKSMVVMTWRDETRPFFPYQSKKLKN